MRAHICGIVISKIITILKNKIFIVKIDIKTFSDIKDMYLFVRNIFVLSQLVVLP